MKRFPATECRLIIPKGADFEKTWIYYPDGVDQDPKDWTDHTGKAHLRANFAAEVPLLEFLVMLGADGSVRLSAEHTATESLKSSAAVWDLYITDPEGKVDRFLAGAAKITPQVTHD